MSFSLMSGVLLEGSGPVTSEIKHLSSYHKKIGWNILISIFIFELTQYR